LPGHESTEIAAPISDDHDLLRRRKKLRYFLLDRFGRNFMPGIQDNQVLDAAADAPIRSNVYFALIAGVEPPLLQYAGSFFGPIPVARENVRPAHDDLFVLADLHLDPGNHRANVA